MIKLAKDGLDADRGLIVLGFCAEKCNRILKTITIDAKRIEKRFSCLAFLMARQPLN